MRVRLLRGRHRRGACRGSAKRRGSGAHGGCRLRCAAGAPWPGRVVRHLALRHVGEALPRYRRDHRWPFAPGICAGQARHRGQKRHHHANGHAVLQRGPGRYQPGQRRHLRQHARLRGHAFARGPQKRRSRIRAGGDVRARCQCAGCHQQKGCGCRGSNGNRDRQIRGGPVCVRGR